MKHPASWGVHEETSFLIDFFSLAGRTDLQRLNRLIKEQEKGGRNWAIHRAIQKDIEKEGPGRAKAGIYDKSMFWDMTRFIRNKIAHFADSHENLIEAFGSPQGLINYFNDHIVEGGDLVFALWNEVRRKRILRLTHFWNM